MKSVSVFPGYLRKFVLGGCVMMLLQACATTVIRPIGESQKDQSGAFDGTWLMEAKKSAGIQYGPGNWQFNCTHQTGELGVLFVSEGSASMTIAGKAARTFVNQSGQFRFEVPISTTAQTTSTSDSSIDRNKMTLIIAGSLEQGAGFLTRGIEQFANNGCTTKLGYRRR